MSIASQYNAAVDFTDALMAMSHENPTVRAVAARKAEEAFQRLVKARNEVEAVPSIEFGSEIPALTSARRSDMCRKSRAEAV